MVHVCTEDVVWHDGEYYPREVLEQWQARRREIVCAATAAVVVPREEPQS